MKANIPELRYRSLPRALLRFKRNITEIPYGFFDSARDLNSTSSKDKITKRPVNKYSKSNMHSFSPDPYTISFKSEIRKALDFVKKNPETKIQKKIERLPTIRYRNRDELAMKNFIEAMFLNGNSEYKKSISDLDGENADTVSAEKILLEAKKIITHGVRKKQSKIKIRDNLDYFWYNFISKESIIRWDIFEDNFILYISSYMMLDYGIIRKVNWKKVLNSLYSKICKQSPMYSLWVSSPSFTIPPMLYEVVSLKDFRMVFEGQESVQILFNSIDELISGPIRHKEDVEYEYSCGCIYKGQWKEGKREGNGVLKLCSTEKYSGIFNKGLFHDFGTLQGQNLAYKGFFRKDQLHGFGKISYGNGSFFEGKFNKCEFVNGLLKWTDGKAYQGEFLHGEYSGKGKLTTSYGEISEGMWINGKLNGDCLVSTRDGYKIKGSFKDGALNSIGKLSCSEYTYRGGFSDSKPSGKGKFLFKSGIEYEGEVKDGKIDGFGVMKYPSGEEYEGFFVNSEQSGVGKIKFPNGKVYEGQVDSGKASGTGIFVFPEGSALEKYEGEVKDGEIEGNGEGWFKDGGYYKGQWANGEIEGIGIWSKQGIRYDGEIRNKTFHGYGRITIGSSFYAGIWNYGKPDGKGEIKDGKDVFYTGMFKDGATVIKSKIDKAFLNLISSIRL